MDTDDFENYRELILENIEFESLCQQFPYDIEALQDIVQKQNDIWDGLNKVLTRLGSIS